MSSHDTKEEHPRVRRTRWNKDERTVAEHHGHQKTDDLPELNEEEYDEQWEHEWEDIDELENRRTNYDQKPYYNRGRGRGQMRGRRAQGAYKYNYRSRYDREHNADSNLKTRREPMYSMEEDENLDLPPGEEMTNLKVKIQDGRRVAEPEESSDVGFSHETGNQPSRGRFTRGRASRGYYSNAYGTRGHWNTRGSYQRFSPEKDIVDCREVLNRRKRLHSDTLECDLREKLQRRETDSGDLRDILDSKDSSTADLRGIIVPPPDLSLIDEYQAGNSPVYSEQDGMERSRSLTPVFDASSGHYRDRHVEGEDKVAHYERENMDLDNRSQERWQREFSEERETRSEMVRNEDQVVAREGAILDQRRRLTRISRPGRRSPEQQNEQWRSYSSEREDSSRWNQNNAWHLNEVPDRGTRRGHEDSRDEGFSRDDNRTRDQDKQWERDRSRDDSSHGDHGRADDLIRARAAKFGREMFGDGGGTRAASGSRDRVGVLSVEREMNKGRVSRTWSMEGNQSMGQWSRERSLSVDSKKERGREHLNSGEGLPPWDDGRKFSLDRGRQDRDRNTSRERIRSLSRDIVRSPTRERARGAQRDRVRSPARGSIGSPLRGAIGSPARGPIGSPPRALLRTPPRGLLRSTQRGVLRSPPRTLIRNSPRGLARSPPRDRHRTPSRERARSPIRERVNSPPRERARSPPRQQLRSPPRQRLRSPPQGRERSPVGERARSPRGRARSPSREQIRSPPREAVRSPHRERVRSPPRDRARSPIRERARSPHREQHIRSPPRLRSPQRERVRSPPRPRMRSPARDRVRSPPRNPTRDQMVSSSFERDIQNHERRGRDEEKGRAQEQPRNSSRELNKNKARDNVRDKSPDRSRRRSQDRNRENTQPMLRGFTREAPQAPDRDKVRKQNEEIISKERSRERVRSPISRDKPPNNDTFYKKEDQRFSRGNLKEKFVKKDDMKAGRRLPNDDQRVSHSDQNVSQEWEKIRDYQERRNCQPTGLPFLEESRKKFDSSRDERLKDRGARESKLPFLEEKSSPPSNHDPGKSWLSQSSRHLEQPHSSWTSPPKRERDGRPQGGSRDESSSQKPGSSPLSHSINNPQVSSNGNNGECWQRRSYTPGADTHWDKPRSDFDAGRSQYSKALKTPKEVVFVRGLARDITDHDIRKDISECRLWPKDVKVVMDGDSGISRGLAFVTFNSVDEATRWMELRKGVLNLRENNHAPMDYSHPTSRDWECVRCHTMNFRHRIACHLCGRNKEDCLDGWEDASPYPTNAILLRGLNSSTSNTEVIKTLKSRLGGSSRLDGVQMGKDVNGRGRPLCFVQLTSVVDSIALHKSLTTEPLYVDGQLAIVSYCQLDKLPTVMEPCGPHANQQTHTRLPAAIAPNLTGGLLNIPPGSPGSNIPLVTRTPVASALKGLGISTQTIRSMLGGNYTEKDIPILAQYCATAYAKTPQERMAYINYYTKHYKDRLVKSAASKLMKLT